MPKRAQTRRRREQKASLRSSRLRRHRSPSTTLRRPLLHVRSRRGGVLRRRRWRPHREPCVTRRRRSSAWRPHLPPPKEPSRQRTRQCSARLERWGSARPARLRQRSAPLLPMQSSQRRKRRVQPSGASMLRCLLLCSKGSRARKRRRQTAGSPAPRRRQLPSRGRPQHTQRPSRRLLRSGVGWRRAWLVPRSSATRPSMRHSGRGTKPRRGERRLRRRRESASGERRPCLRHAPTPFPNG
mmetsp:Transcript_40853/g.135321  ORF Transcript_40853/g.135321 Transcript_40853/m.135321 type:complete len:241 (-) Transcript_40853:1401-2123(-)